MTSFSDSTKTCSENRNEKSEGGTRNKGHRKNLLQQHLLGQYGMIIGDDHDGDKYRTITLTIIAITTLVYVIIAAVITIRSTFTTLSTAVIIALVIAIFAAYHQTYQRLHRCQETHCHGR